MHSVSGIKDGRISSSSSLKQLFEQPRVFDLKLFPFIPFNMLEERLLQFYSTAISPFSPVRTRKASSSGQINIFPSPIWAV